MQAVAKEARKLVTWHLAPQRSFPGPSLPFHMHQHALAFPSDRVGRLRCLQTYEVVALNMKQPRVGLPLHLQSRSCCPRRAQHQHRWYFITITLPSPLLASLLFALYHDNIVVAMTMNSNANGPVPKELTDAQKKKRAKEQAKRKDWRHKEQNGGENANADSQPALDFGVIMKGSRFSDFPIEEPTVHSGAYDPCPSKRYHDV
jgi:hypothetical protein